MKPKNESATTAMRDPRYERKFLVRGIDVFSLRKMICLSEGVFIERYHARTVNNIYFDGPDFELYSSSVRGYPVRKKIRIRWYGSTEGEIAGAVLEVKSKSGATNSKNSYPLGPLTITKGCDLTHQIEAAFLMAGLPEPLFSELKALRPVMLNTYRRTYYESASYGVRLTLDNDLKFYGINGNANMFLRRTAEPEISVIELKYKPESEGVVSRMTSRFPFRLTKCSKYVMGINRVYLFSDLA